MDIQRPDLKRKRLIRYLLYAGLAITVVAAAVVGIGLLDTAAPRVERASVWTGTVERGEFVREVRGPGNLVAREIRWIPAASPGRVERIEVRRRPFRIEGRAHHLLVLTNAEAVLGAERREAWQSLVRVLGHEINNSLSPIKSIAQTMASTLADEPGSKDGRETPADLIESLNLIASRADALGRFVAGYAALARLPNPEPQRIGLRELAERIAVMETRCQVGLSGPDIHVLADPDQLEQALINLVRNAVDAVQEAGDEVTIGWRQQRANVEIEVVDNGPGPPESNNLFVPFFTTKPGGSGIGLLLARRIAELHGGTLDLVKRTDGQGARALLSLPGIPIHATRRD